MLSFRTRGGYYKVGGGGGGGTDVCTQLSCIAPPCMEWKLFIETRVQIQANCTIKSILHIYIPKCRFRLSFLEANSEATSSKSILAVLSL